MPFVSHKDTLESKKRQELTYHSQPLPIELSK